MDSTRRHSFVPAALPEVLFLMPFEIGGRGSWIRTNDLQYPNSIYLVSGSFLDIPIVDYIPLKPCES
jgi:hypothetical protein